jgi:hypothetical protein
MPYLGSPRVKYGNNDKRGRAGARSRPNMFFRKNQLAGLPTLVHTSSRHIVHLQFSSVDFGSAAIAVSHFDGFANSPY